MIATGLGSLPGTDMPSAVRVSLETFPDLGFLPELPARGVGADMIGRSTAFLTGLPVDQQPAGWRLTSAPSRDGGRAQSWLRFDLDDLTEAAQGYPGRIKLSVCGPWTLAACLERPRGDKVLADHGARREVAQSLATGVTDFLTEVVRLLPDNQLVLQIDEPMLPMVASGSVATASGFSRHREIDSDELVGALAIVVASAKGLVGETALHCCAPGLDLDVVAKAGLDAVSLDLGQLTGADHLAVTEWLAAGRRFWAGVVPTDPPSAAVTVPHPDEIVRTVISLVHRLEFDPVIVRDALVLTPACGLALWDAAAAHKLLQTLQRAAEISGEVDF